MKIHVKERTGKKASNSMPITRKQLAELCVEVCGGGMTEESTTQAIILQRRLLDKEVVHRGKYSWALEID